MFGTAVVSLIVAFVFLAGVYAFSPAIQARLRAPRRVPVPILIEVPRRRSRR